MCKLSQSINISLILACITGNVVLADTVNTPELTDPTRPKNYLQNTLQIAATKGVISFELSAIFTNPTARYVVINEETLQVGDELDGYRITKITKDSVTLEGKVANRVDAKTLFLFNKDVKTHAVR